MATLFLLGLLNLSFTFAQSCTFDFSEGSVQQIIANQNGNYHGQDADLFLNCSAAAVQLFGYFTQQKDQVSFPQLAAGDGWNIASIVGGCGFWIQRSPVAMSLQEGTPAETFGISTDLFNAIFSLGGSCLVGTIPIGSSSAWIARVGAAGSILAKRQENPVTHNALEAASSVLTKEQGSPIASRYLKSRSVLAKRNKPQLQSHGGFRLFRAAQSIIQQWQFSWPTISNGYQWSVLSASLRGMFHSIAAVTGPSTQTTFGRYTIIITAMGTFRLNQLAQCFTADGFVDFMRYIYNDMESQNGYAGTYWLVGSMLPPPFNNYPQDCYVVTIDRVPFQ